MKSERELLEAAAKAAGIALHIVGDGEGGATLYSFPDMLYWNPLIDDGDNRRLQIKLNLGLVPQEEGGWVCLTYDSEGDEVSLAVDADPNRAIVRAAAAMAA